MTSSIITFGLAMLLAGTTLAQQQPRRSTNAKSSSGSTSTVAPNDMNRSTSTVKPQEGAAGAPTGTGLTNDQAQAASTPEHTTGTTKVDARSSVIKGHSTDVKPNKIKPKKQN